MLGVAKTRFWRMIILPPSLYKQACAKCEQGYRPLFMWVNYYSQDDRSDRSEDVDEEDGHAPHHRQRCEACRRGVCDAL